MPQNRRNYYRLLHVQPDAPVAVIKACYRTLMSTLRLHPDLGGDHETAALINEAYAVLSDDARRAAYDAARAARSKRGVPRAERRSRSTAEGASPPPAAEPNRGPRCPFCSLRLPAITSRNARCANCRAPLTAVARPEQPTARADRRGMPRVSKSDWALLHLDARHEGIDVRLRDLSLDGISLFTGMELPLQQRVRIVGSTLDVVAEVVSCRRAGTVFTVHAGLITAVFAQRAGVFVSATA